MILIFPPGWAPFSPFLALPQLKGFLNSEGLDVEIKDENINFFDNFISSKFYKEQIPLIERKWNELDNKEIKNKKDIQKTIKFLKILSLRKEYKKIDIIKEKYRNGEAFKAKDLNGIFEITSSILEEIYENFKITLTGITNSKYSSDSIESLKKFLEDNDENMYYDYFLKYSNILEKIEEEFYVGISITGVSQIYSAFTLAKLIRLKFGKNKKIFFGGNFISRISRYYKEKIHFIFELVDFISIGDGEITLKALLENKKYHEIPNILYLEDGQIKKTKEKYFFLNREVVPNFDGFPLGKYFSSRLVLPIFSSRSCYSNCAFCTISKATLGPYRVYSVEQVIKILIELKEKYGCEYFSFVDETFYGKRLIEFARELIKNKIEIFWYAETRFDYEFSKEDVKILNTAGCRKMQFGVESYNERILKLMNKNIIFSFIEETIKKFIDNDIGVHLFFMIGFPGEKEESKRTFIFMNEMLRYGNKKSKFYPVTAGSGSFGLEIGSDVQKNFNKYGIRILTNYNDDDFIGLSLNYETVGEFLTQERAPKIVELKKITKNNNLFFMNKIFFSEIQNFLEIALKIETNLDIMKIGEEVIALKNGLLKKGDCQYIVINFPMNNIKLIRNRMLLPYYKNKINYSIELFIKKLVMNPYIKIIDNKGEKNIIYLKNILNGEKFETSNEGLKELLKFKTKKEKLEKENIDFYKFLFENNII